MDRDLYADLVGFIPEKYFISRIVCGKSIFTRISFVDYERLEYLITNFYRPSKYGDHYPEEVVAWFKPSKATQSSPNFITVFAIESVYQEYGSYVVSPISSIDKELLRKLREISNGKLEYHKLKIAINNKKFASMVCKRARNSSTL